jgi:hypothetical protein
MKGEASMAMQQWEYVVLVRNSRNEWSAMGPDSQRVDEVRARHMADVLNAFGEGGWQLEASHFNETDQTVQMILKRPKLRAPSRPVARGSVRPV